MVTVELKDALIDLARRRGAGKYEVLSSTQVRLEEEADDTVQLRMVGGRDLALAADTLRSPGLKLLIGGSVVFRYLGEEGSLLN